MIYIFSSFSPRHFTWNEVLKKLWEGLISLEIKSSSSLLKIKSDWRAASFFPPLLAALLSQLSNQHFEIAILFSVFEGSDNCPCYYDMTPTVLGMSAVSYLISTLFTYLTLLPPVPPEHPGRAANHPSYVLFPMCLPIGVRLLN